MVVGTTGGGKTVIIETLAAAHKVAFDEVVKVLTINPKAQGTDELYGVLGMAKKNRKLSRRNLNHFLEIS